MNKEFTSQISIKMTQNSMPNWIKSIVQIENSSLL